MKSGFQSQEVWVVRFGNDTVYGAIAALCNATAGSVVIERPGACKRTSSLAMVWETTPSP